MTVTRRVPGGRGSNRILDPKIWGEPIRLRPTLHGGLLARWRGDRFLSPARVEREFDVWLELARRGVALPEPVLMARPTGSRLSPT